jgi:hypothetical protein
MNTKVIAAIAEAIRGLREVPSGHLYAQLMGHMTLDQYGQVIAILKRAGLVEEKSHLLRWVGPNVAPKAQAKEPA